MMAQLVHKLFSNQCRLTTLRLDIVNVEKSTDFYQYLDPSYHPTLNQLRCCCITLRYLYVRLIHIYSLEYIIEHVPALERLSVHFVDALISERDTEWTIRRLKRTEGNWLNKVRQIQYSVGRLSYQNPL
jgi:hypothetical protein